MGVLTIVVLFVIGITSAIILFYKRKYLYWKERGVKYFEPSIPLGNISFREHITDFLIGAYSLKADTDVVGAFLLWKPVLVPTSLDLIQNILVKDFNSFHERGVYVNEEADPLSAHMFSLDGEKWKSIRSKLSPTFTSGKMKLMFSTVVEVGDRLNNTLAELCDSESNLEIKDIMARFTTDIIGSCAFGIECNSLKDPNVAFRRYGRKVFEQPHLNPLMQVVVTLYPEIGRKFNISLNGKALNEFFLETVRNTIAYREDNNVRRNDFMDLLIQMKNDSSTKLSVAEIVAQAFLFFVAGFDTSSSTLTFALYELALNPDIQERGRQEIDEVLAKYDGELTYEAVQDMVYIDHIISEAIRKYPPVIFLIRKAVRDYPVSNSKTTIEKGMPVFIPSYAIHHDPEIFPNPEDFDPERFTPDNVKSRHPMSFLGFGDGPRNCVGMRFGRMQSRIGLITLLKNYRFEPCSKTKIPVVFDKKNGLLSPEGGLFLKVEKR